MLNQKTIETIEQTIGYEFCDKQLLTRAFTRASYRNEHPESPDNELLEFIGDSALSLIVVNILINHFQQTDCGKFCVNKSESDFTKLKSALVNKQFLSERMRKLQLHDFLQTSAGDLSQGIHKENSVLEDLFESIVGAIYLDSRRDLKRTGTIVARLLDSENFLCQNGTKSHISYKNDVQEWSQKYGYGLPQYTTEATDGGFVTYCKIAKFGFSGYGEGHNQKEAENNAAKSLMQELESSFIPTEPHIFFVSPQTAKNVLQEYCQRSHCALPFYDTICEEVHSDNSHTFTVKCVLEQYAVIGKGDTKKEAEKQAAYSMLKELGLIV